jgi:hypothetical protein
MDPLFSVLCMDRGEHPVYGLVAGRIYFNANIWGAVFRDLPGPEDLDFMEAAGSHKGLQQVAERLRNAVEEDLPDMKFRRLKFFIKIPLIIIGALGYTPDKGRRILAKVGVTTEKWSCLEVASLETGEIVTQRDIRQRAIFVQYFSSTSDSRYGMYQMAPGRQYKRWKTLGRHWRYGRCYCRSGYLAIGRGG